MANIKVTPDDLRTLDLKASLAYDTLKRAVNAPEFVSSAECLYQHDLGGFLAELSRKATNDFRRLNKGGKRASEIEQYILQYVLMRGTASAETFQIEITGDPEDGMGGLRAFLNAEDDLSSEEGEVFRLIQIKTAELKKAGRYDLIKSAMKYVRETYQPVI